LTNSYRTDDIPRAGLTIVANVAIATGPALLGAPRSTVIKFIYYINLIYFSLGSQYFAKFAVSSKRRFSIEPSLYPEFLVWFYVRSHATQDMRLRSAVLPF